MMTFISISISSHHLRVLSISIINFPSSLQNFRENVNIVQVVQNFIWAVYLSICLSSSDTFLVVTLYYQSYCGRHAFLEPLVQSVQWFFRRGFQWGTNVLIWNLNYPSQDRVLGKVAKIYKVCWDNNWYLLPVKFHWNPSSSFQEEVKMKKKVYGQTDRWLTKCRHNSLLQHWHRFILEIKIFRKQF